MTAAGGHAAGLVDLAAGVRPAGLEVPFDVLPTAALQDLIGFAADGSPLRDVFEQIAPGVAQRVTDTLGVSLAAGLGPRETARLLRRQFGAGLARALTISRTETLRAYREAMHRNYEANDDVIDGWVWLAKLDTRTCAACWAMHGSEHSLDERLSDHPNGRCGCAQAQAVAGAGRGHSRPPACSEPGPTAFERLPDKGQERTGQGGVRSHRDGAVTLEQFAGRRRSLVRRYAAGGQSRRLVGKELARNTSRRAAGLRKRKLAGRLTAG